MKCSPPRCVIWHRVIGILWRCWSSHARAASCCRSTSTAQNFSATTPIIASGQNCHHPRMIASSVLASLKPRIVSGALWHSGSAGVFLHGNTPTPIGTGQRAEMRPPAAPNDRLETPASRARPLLRDGGVDNGRRGGREKEKVELLKAALARW